MSVSIQNEKLVITLGTFQTGEELKWLFESTVESIKINSLIQGELEQKIKDRIFPQLVLLESLSLNNQQLSAGLSHPQLAKLKLHSTDISSRINVHIQALKLLVAQDVPIDEAGKALLIACCDQLLSIPLNASHYNTALGLKPYQDDIYNAVV